MCPPGTYFCQTPGNCAQCLLDSDCANQRLPTFDPTRPRCDLDSGVAGYQNFCQQCLRDGDCAAMAVDNRCDLDPNSVEPSIETIGFETCANLGPGCPYGTQPAIGGCESTPCMTDADCAGAVSGAQFLFIDIPQEAEPFCSNGRCSPFPAAGSFSCPNWYCENDNVCPDPQLECDVNNAHCACTSSDQCGEAWPLCVFPDGGDVDDAGAPLGACGCETDQDCGDAGLRCLTLPPDSYHYGGKACVFACTDPRFPGCADISPTTPLCEPTSGLCVACDTDQHCRTQAAGLFVGPFCRLDGVCGCQVSGDCPAHEACAGPPVRSQEGSLLGECSVPALPCVSGVCAACGRDGGGCGQCVTDFDCPGNLSSFCDVDAGACIMCRDNSDCLAIGQASQGNARCVARVCTSGCTADSDCVGSSDGAHCVTNDAQTSACGCAHDSDCAGNVLGPH